MSMGAVGDQFTDINVTPLTDVFLVLLVIMILIAPLIDKSDLKIKPPTSYDHAEKSFRAKKLRVPSPKVWRRFLWPCSYSMSANELCNRKLRLATL